ncbi:MULTISPECIES: bifunctional 3-(3-hydroxy-phenyl)propionate/3-hydroxycinnamic acid hydroxylase [unclassified Sphingomonas]|uniref:bifunctional 3-(3-hydroxy-phenyl)propionate/3-hydroxycinnamic acid hydroxylase n=1 Tax=unclassified Sphingomonas TaxID=196159 RepID=UPI000929770B|nr:MULTISPECIES: bifunctional 3-(3-hydroxy-phenyl)propionate/3-hydroxycinnamic acid hydroxylase [unclassified Sphingomonas]MBN8848750.1 bifunctional 3-(3-hydroxy-phenyl)propionate/3-hydroxycinnamic acid hydroxylase [Sphingomonas sp.]OJV34345.1 MAG: monooxygenase [Sphingomonas sp. 67-36]
MSSHFDVVLVGYGPTAQLLAVALGRQGRSVAVVERWEERYPLPRAVHIDHEIFRIIAAQGLDAPLSAICHGAAKYQWFNADWEELLVIDLSAPPVSGGLSANYINQPLLEEVLDTGVRAQPGVRLFLGREAISVGQNEQGAWVEAKHVATGETERFTGRYVIGCDGANSLVRNYISGGVEDLGFQEHWLVVDVLLKDGVTVEGLGLPESGQYCNPERPTTIVPAGIDKDGRLFRRWEFMKLPGEAIEDLESEAKVWELLDRWARPDQVELVRHRTYNFRSLISNQWRDRRVMIAGDAAHLTPPFLGQGLCSGIRDSWNLAWRLALALDDNATDAIFEDYTRERYPHVRQMIEMAVYLGEVICLADPAEAAKRDAAFASGAYPPFPDYPCLTTGLLHRLDDGRLQPGAGLLGPHAIIERDGKAARMDSVFGPGFLLVLRGLDPAAIPARAQDILNRIGGQILLLGEEAGAWRDCEGRITGFLDRRDWSAMVVRPDFYVYGGAASGEELGALLEDFANDLADAGLAVPDMA